VGKCRNDHLIAGTDVEAVEREVKRDCSVADADGMTRAGGGRDCSLEPVDVDADRRYPAAVDAVHHIAALVSGKIRLIDWDVSWAVPQVCGDLGNACHGILGSSMRLRSGEFADTATTCRRGDDPWAGGEAAPGCLLRSLQRQYL